MGAANFTRLSIENPKQYADRNPVSSERIFPYYAGYSRSFTTRLLESMALDSSALVLDPWNGSGTTTHAARALDVASTGFDLNPVMVLVARASLLSSREIASLVPLAESFIENAKRSQTPRTPGDDMLLKWLTPHSSSVVRALEIEVNRHLISHHQYTSLTSQEALNEVSGIASFFYVALFRATRRVLRDFIPTNPTWIKPPQCAAQRKRPTGEFIFAIFLKEVRLLVANIQNNKEEFLDDATPTQINVGTAENLPVANGSVDVVLTSPPYCTRIDYAVATAIELAILRYDAKSFDQLRRSLMGSSTVPGAFQSVEKDWGKVCNDFLNTMAKHSSKASSTYYLKNHVQYFSSLHNAIGELSRVLAKRGRCVLVVQDSFYKELHNDVPAIATEMASMHRLKIRRREDFKTSRSMVGLNSRSKAYLPKRQSVESVLCFERT